MAKSPKKPAADAKQVGAEVIKQINDVLGGGVESIKFVNPDTDETMATFHAPPGDLPSPDGIAVTSTPDTPDFMKNMSPEQQAAMMDFMNATIKKTVANVVDKVVAPIGNVTGTPPNPADSAATLAKLLGTINQNPQALPDEKNAAGLEIMKGSEADSHFLVIARKSGLKLGIRPIVFPTKLDNVTFVTLGFRLRVQTESVDGNVLLSGTTFGIPFNEKSTHASIVCGVRLINLPCSPEQAYNLWQENLITQSMVGSLIEKLEAQKVTFAATPDQIVEYLNLVYDTQLPNIPTVIPKEFNLVYGFDKK